MQLIDTFPTNKIKDLEYRVGRVFPFGATLTDGGVNFSIFSKEATGATLVLYHHGQKEPFVEIPFPEEFRNLIDEFFCRPAVGDIRMKAFGQVEKFGITAIAAGIVPPQHEEPLPGTFSRMPGGNDHPHTVAESAHRFNDNGVLVHHRQV